MEPTPTSTSERPIGWDEAIAEAARLGTAEWEIDAEPVEFPTEPDPATAIPQPVAKSANTVIEPVEAPPAPLEIVEAMLFIGGPPLTSDVACGAIRGLTSENFRELIDEITRRYRGQNRPYTVQPRGPGWVLALRSAHRGVIEKLFGGPKEARLTQPAIDVLSLIAYKQPLAKA